MKTVFLFIGLFFAIALANAQDLEQIKKNIPFKKVINIAGISSNTNLFTFEYKDGNGLWDNEKKLVVHTSKKAFQILSTQHKNTYFIYNSDYMGFYLLPNSKTYIVNGIDTSFVELLKGRFTIYYDNQDNLLHFQDTLSKDNFIISRTTKDIIVEYNNTSNYIQNYKVIDLAANKITIDVNDGYFQRIKMGYVHRIDNTVNIYDTFYKKLTNDFTLSDFMNIDKLNQVVGCSIDSIRYRNLVEAVYKCNEKYGCINFYEGVKLEPIYDMIKNGYLVDILVSNNKLGAFNSETNLYIPVNYTSVESYSFEFCHPYVKIGERIFEGVYYQCELFDALNEIKNGDSLNLTKEKRDALAIIANGNLIYSTGSRNYDASSSGLIDDLNWWHGYEGSSGIYNFDSDKWVVTPDKYLVHPYGEYYLVGENHAESIKGNFYFIDSTYQKIYNKEYNNYKYADNQLFVCDTNSSWFAVDETTFQFTELGIFDRNDLLKKMNNYFMIGHNNISLYGDDNFIVEGIFDRNFKQLKNLESGWFDYFLMNDFVIIKRDQSGYGEFEFALYDLLNDKVISKWDFSEDHQEATKISIGYGEDAEIYDITTLRK